MWRGLLVLGLIVTACDSSASSPEATDGDAEAVIPVTDAAADAAPPSMEDARVDAPDAGDGALADGAVADGTDAGQQADAASPPDAALFRCDVQAPTACPDPAPRYADISLIIEERCESCHSPRWTGPWPLDTYQHVADWQSEVRSHVLACTMPPPESGLTMTHEERLQILTWLRCGLPQ